LPHRVFNLDEVAQFLHVSRQNVEQLVRDKEIPFERQGNRIVFRKKAIEEWASQRILGLSGSGLSDYHKTTSAKYHDLSESHAILPELIKPAYVDPAVAAKTKASVIRHIVRLADQTGLLIHADDLLKGLIERERMCSTALAGGIALLHPRNHDPYLCEDTFIVLGRTIQPIPFGSPDGRTTDLFFLICSQDDRIHLHVLARLCMLCYHTSLLLDLREGAEAHELHESLLRAEEEIIREL